MARDVEVAAPTPDRWGLRNGGRREQVESGPSIVDRIEADLKASGIKPPLGGEAGTSLMERLADDLNRTPLEETAQHIYDLRFHDLIELCTSAIGKNSEKLKVEAYDLATGLSSWAIETLAKKAKS